MNSILVCRCASSSLIPETHLHIIDTWLRQERGAAVTDDLCGLCAEHPDIVRQRLKSGSVTVIACHQRSVRSLLDFAGAGPAAGRLKVINYFTSSAAELSAALEELDPETRPNTAAAGGETDWIPWYPVIDTGRCTSCGQCASFCIFGAYEYENGTICVSSPRSCKTNCPACARVCPQAAIIFPKHNEAPINGDEISDEESLKETIRLNIHDLLGDDVYAALARRRQRAKRPLLKVKDAARAEEERQRHLDPET